MFNFHLAKNMKTSIFVKITLPVLTMSFILSYVWNLSLSNWEQYFALTLSICVDGVFGIINGVKKEGFKTFKALNILKSLFTWLLMLTCILVTEKAFPYASWLSETFIIPVIVFMFISSLKNASQSGFIKAELLNKIMEKIDQHKN
jgi:small basic protein